MHRSPAAWEDNMTYNDLAKAGFGFVCALLLGVVVSLLGDVLVSPIRPKIAGYTFPVAAPVAAAAKESKVAVVTVEDLLAKADPARGRELAQVCGACHSFSKIGATKFGPNLYGVVGRPKHSFPGFAYSDGMKAKAGSWTFADIDTWIANPKAVVADTRMNFPGEPDPAKRADIIAYLRTLSDSPVPLTKN
jgi:cytochrome c